MGPPGIKLPPNIHIHKTFQLRHQLIHALLYETPGSSLQQSRQLAAARLAQSVERETLNLKVVGSTPTSGSIPDVPSGTTSSFWHFLLLLCCLFDSFWLGQTGWSSHGHNT
ncbi:hypothetical protein B0H65DRAFT_90814 [Neurospora tetraspora]|uniref:Uncharacterized protein n=1 Tax=Neurospora tetraspora TaxID=94610 RepID=A0AAE0JIY8_9PEZI|nr:hypothetical protein B0H65DRAFT_90814 [Neurospora tetraspora]